MRSQKERLKAKKLRTDTLFFFEWNPKTLNWISGQKENERNHIIKGINVVSSTYYRGECEMWNKKTNENIDDHSTAVD